MLLLRKNKTIIHLFYFNGLAKVSWCLSSLLFLKTFPKWFGNVVLTAWARLCAIPYKSQAGQFNRSDF